MIKIIKLLERALAFALRTHGKKELKKAKISCRAAELWGDHKQKRLEAARKAHLEAQQNISKRILEQQAAQEAFHKLKQRADNLQNSDY